MVYTPRDSVSNFCLGEEEMTISITGSSNTCEILFWIFREEEADMTTNTEGVTPSEGVHTGGVQLSEKSWKFSDGEMILLKISERGCESTRVPEARGAGRGWRLGARSRGVPAPPAMGLPEARGPGRGWRLGARSRGQLEEYHMALYSVCDTEINNWVNFHPVPHCE